MKTGQQFDILDFGLTRPKHTIYVPLRKASRETENFPGMVDINKRPLKAIGRQISSPVYIPPFSNVIFPRG